MSLDKCHTCRKPGVHFINAFGSWVTGPGSNEGSSESSVESSGEGSGEVFQDTKPAIPHFMCPVCLCVCLFEGLLSCGHTICKECYQVLADRDAQEQAVRVLPQLPQEPQESLPPPPVPIDICPIPLFMMLAELRAPDATYQILPGDTCGYCPRQARSWIRRINADTRNRGWRMCCRPLNAP